jgi:hypothetical protein
VTVLSLIQDASVQGLGISRPTAVMASSEQEHIELAALVNELGEGIARAAEWNELKVLHTITGTGSQTEFALPDDFDRFPKKQKLRTSRMAGAWLRNETDHDAWLRAAMNPMEILDSWTLLGGSIHFNHAPQSGELVKFYYLSNKWALTSGQPSVRFTADADTYRLRERTLKLSLIAKWRANKGLSFETYAASASHALAEDIARDKGPRDIRIGEPTMPHGVTLAYPGIIEA